jgi:hypothetical protein
VAPFKTGFAAALAPPYLRGQAYLAQRSSLHAAEEFQRMPGSPRVGDTDILFPAALGGRSFRKKYRRPTKPTERLPVSE